MECSLVAALDVAQELVDRSRPLFDRLDDVLRAAEGIELRGRGDPRLIVAAADGFFSELVEGGDRDCLADERSVLHGRALRVEYEPAGLFAVAVGTDVEPDSGRRLGGRAPPAIFPRAGKSARELPPPPPRLG